MKYQPVRNLLGLGLLGGTLLCSGPSVTGKSQQETAEQFVDRVKKAIENAEWDRARSGIRHALALRPESAEANFVAAQVYWHEGARSMAIASLQKAIESQPFFPEAHFLHAQCLKESNNLVRARDEANIAISQGSPPYAAYRLLAEIDLAQGDFGAAVSSLETALRFSRDADQPDAARVKDEIDKTREFIESLERLAVLQGDQKTLDVVRPRLLNSPHPRYTREARAAKLQGVVLMGVLVTESGDVGSVLVLRGLGLGLDEQAREAAGNLKFRPASRSGQAIPYLMRVSIEFVLK